MTEQPWTSQEDAAEWAAGLLRETRMTTTELAAQSKAGDLKGWEERHWNAIRTISWFAKGMTGEPPAFSAWLLSQVRRAGLRPSGGGDVGWFAHYYSDLSTCGVARTSAEVLAHFEEIGDCDDWDDESWARFEAAKAEFLAVAKANRWRTILKQEADAAAIVHALYRFFDAGNRLLYIGLTLDPGSRWKGHARDKPWWLDVHTVTIEHFPDRPSVERAEKAAIKAEAPRHNVVHNRPTAGPSPRPDVPAVATRPSRSAQPDRRPRRRHARRPDMAEGPPNPHRIPGPSTEPRRQLGRHDGVGRGVEYLHRDQG